MSGLTAALPAALFSAACSRVPDAIPLPSQRRARTGPPARPFGPFLRASGPHAAMYIVSGIGPCEFTFVKPVPAAWTDKVLVEAGFR